MQSCISKVWTIFSGFFKIQASQNSIHTYSQNYLLEYFSLYLFGKLRNIQFTVLISLITPTHDVFIKLAPNKKRGEID